MAPELNQATIQEEIQVYHNDFYSGFARLVKKLFML